MKMKSSNAKNTYIKKISSITKGSSEFLPGMDVGEGNKNNEKKVIKKNKSKEFNNQQNSSNDEKHEAEQTTTMGKRKR